jgi:hypothetical protein
MIARDGAAILYLNPVDLAGCALQCIEATGERSGNNLAPRGEATDAKAVRFERDFFDFFESGDINDGT